MAFRKRAQSAPARPLVLLGPQRESPNVRDALESLGALGKGAKIAAVTAGWEEREAEDVELGEHLGCDVVNLNTWHRADQVYAEDPELYRALRDRKDQLVELQGLYRMRLAHSLDAARELLERSGESDLLESERTDALEAVRALDAQHLVRVREVHAAFDAETKPLERDAVARHRTELEELTEGATAFCVAGGHVRVLLNRMRLFDVPSLFGDRPVVAWSAGAMVLTERIVLFHDRPPQGRGNAELLDDGLGLAKGLVALPHAAARLALDDPLRVGLFARRFAPAACVALDTGTQLERGATGWTARAEASRLGAEGKLEPVGPE